MNSFYFALGLHYLCRQQYIIKKQIMKYVRILFAVALVFYGMFSILIQEG